MVSEMQEKNKKSLLNLRRGVIIMTVNTNTCPKEQLDAPQNRASRLRQWPCKIPFVPDSAPYFDGAELLIAADCTAYAHGNFHFEFMKNAITLIGCVALNSEVIRKKLAAIIANNDIKGIKLLRMEVSCCERLEGLVREAVAESEKNLPVEILVLSTDGKILKGKIK
jgi:hypothetical protein